MSNFTDIKAEIDAEITTNGQQAITGAKLNTVLNDMIDEINEKKSDGGGVIEVSEDGLFFVDSQYNIGASLDSNGFHAISILEYEIVN